MYPQIGATMRTSLQYLIAFVVLVAMVSFQLIKTQLHVTVRNDLGNTVSAAKVTLYEKEEDYNAEENAVATGETDEKGVVKFKDLNDKSYFVMVEKDDKNNFGGGEQTGKLEAKRINKVTIVIQ